MYMTVVKYTAPKNWISYNLVAIVNELAEAKAAVLSLKTIPYQRAWADTMQTIQLKREVAGTSKIEGADFTDAELDAAVKAGLNETPEQLATRSQRQAQAAVKAYKWIARLSDDRPIDIALIRDVHRLIITGADDDHCPPGVIRGRDQNVVFGTPPHRGAEGGDECEAVFERFGMAILHEFKDHDILIQALALHYHFAAIHPFLDGNGRTARAVEALMLQRAGLKDSLFIAMSNYYYDEKKAYLKALREVRAKDHDLTAFLRFGLAGIALQCGRLFTQIRAHVSKALFRSVMVDLFTRLMTTKKRVIAKRQMAILNLLLDNDDGLELAQLVRTMDASYSGLRNPRKAIIRDLSYLIEVGAIHAEAISPDNRLKLAVKLDWPTRITEGEFFERVKKYPRAKSLPFLQWGFKV